MKKIEAKWYAKGPKNRKIDLIVIHDMEARNGTETAEGVGRYFAELPAKRKASAHVGCDVDSRVRYVDDNDIAYAAPGANERGLHLELAGYARYLNGDWSRPDMEAMLKIGAGVVREWCDKYNVPKVFLRAADLKAGKRGITTHYEVSQAFKLTDHTDPGPGFPINRFLGSVAGPAPATPQEATVALNLEHDAIKILLVPGKGYYIVASDGGVFGFGDVTFYGSCGNITLDAEITDAALTPSGRGYYLLGADGGLFLFGDAQPFETSEGKFNAVGMIRGR